ncbi:MAG: hypothetical protein KME46_00030 [Brasilonema angustatum HA4187-MV1]|jgi:hypothetical protein|nr:hypothetical protein [Brasilonema angustatum HA4187-MV1]
MKTQTATQSQKISDDAARGEIEELTQIELLAIVGGFSGYASFTLQYDPDGTKARSYGGIGIDLDGRSVG